MLTPRASHLIERATERLLRSGALEGSAAQLLVQPDGKPMADMADNGGTRPVPVPPVSVPPVSAPPVPVPPVVEPSSVVEPLQVGPAQHSAQPTPLTSLASVTAAAADKFEPAPAYTAPPAQKSGPAPAAPSLSAPSIHGPMRGLRQPSNPLLLSADPIGGPLQATPTVDAVSLERAGMIDWSRTRTRISEEFRLVQRQIIRAAFGPGSEPGFSNLLMVTSARPGEGKSFVATNLSGSIARQGDHPVLLIDADSKRDSICYGLGLTQARGLLDLAADPKLDPAPLIVKTSIERLSVLPVGRERERSSELFSLKEMTRLIQSLGRRYADRLLILDAPPCLSTSDPAVLAQVVGQILFVVEADRTQREEIESSLDLIQACPTITMVLNKQQLSSRYTFGAYSSYYSS